MVRERANGLDPEKKYILCCDTGRRSAAAAFLLSQRGLDVCVLEGGMNKSIPADLLGIATDTPPAAVQAEVIGPDRKMSASSNSQKSPEQNSVTDQNTGRSSILQRERDQARKESLHAQNQLAALRQDFAALQTYMVSYIAKSAQLETAIQNEKQARIVLTELIDRLADQAVSPNKKK
jgi:hypothetical protein